jgi:hypothetical protein
MEQSRASNHQKEGLAAVKKKTAGFFSRVEVFNGGYTSDLVFAANQFSVALEVDIKTKGQPRRNMDEICVNQEDKGKLVRVVFFFPAG